MCVYTSTNKLIEQSFNCSFGLIRKNAEVSTTKIMNECKIGDEGNLWSGEGLQDIMKNVKQGEEHK